MPSHMTLQELQATGYRLRRSHEKSRNGCLRCKQQRKKCDEQTPSCSRCTKRSYVCRYQKSHSEAELSEQESIHSSVSDLPVISASGSPVGSSNHRFSDPSLLLGEQADSLARSSTDDKRLGLDPCVPAPLDATELSLLGHYLSHTSQTIPFDDLDLYALAVGVPNLAFKSKAVMSSLLALAAACRSHDVAKQSPNPLDRQSLMEISELLALAERHHRASLHHIQAAMQSSDLYDNVLANAALMVLYASASHSIRVHLAATAKQSGQRLPNELLPQHSQWISFTRAAHTASTAVLNYIVDPATLSPMIDTRLKLPSANLSSKVLSPQNGPSDHTKRLFLPIVASTYIQAFERLRKRAETTVALLQSSDPFASNDPQLHASLETVSILQQCASTALSTRERDPTTETSSNRALSLHKSSRVSPWVASYMISVTSMEAPQALRRIIMSFLNKAPADYLSLVQSVLDAPSNGMTPDFPGAKIPSLTAAHVLAMDIFAHWLVLVMLLDGVWWIGEIGQWELGQIVSLMKTKNPLGQSAETGETWWPESMYMVKRELS
ncbi:Zn(II)2Cys6 transcription factor, partial [Aspergillus homomorphus CBS 101889]